MPDITPAQIVALLQALLGAGAGVGLGQWPLVALVAPIAVAMILADAHIRNGRARIAANPEAMREIAPVEEPFEG